MAITQTSKSALSNGIPMGSMDNPTMTGTWWNPNTGHKFTVKDTFFEDGNFIVMTTDGQRLDYNVIQNYVQYTGHPDEVPKNLKKVESLPDEVINELNEPLGNIYQDIASPIVADNLTPNIGQNIGPSVDMSIISRILDQFDPPQLDATLTWDKAPKEQLNTLVNALNIKPELISQYYINKLDMNAIFLMTKAAIISFINKQLNIENPLQETSRSSKSRRKTKSENIDEQEISER